MQTSVLIRCVAIALAIWPIHAECCKNAIAMLEELSGTATTQSPGSSDRIDVHRLDWLSDGTTLVIGKGSHAVVILMNGHRYELGAGAKAILTADAAPRITGVARELPALPPIPAPAPIRTGSASTAGASHIRGGSEVSGLYPRAGASAIADNITLRFGGVREATSYRVAIDDARGNRLWNITTQKTSVSIPNDTLKPGERYVWHVRAMRSGVELGDGTAEFNTLTIPELAQRSEFVKALGARSDALATLALLGDVDLRLGLIAEACDEFSKALERNPDDAALRRALDDARASLAAGSH
jgi:hypothetical protein